jgi:hypothetical protein
VTTNQQKHSIALETARVLTRLALEMRGAAESEPRKEVALALAKATTMLVSAANQFKEIAILLEQPA